MSRSSVRGGGSDSFSGRRKLFWGNDDHLKSRAALSFQLSFASFAELHCKLYFLKT